MKFVTVGLFIVALPRQHDSFDNKNCISHRKQS